MEEFLQEYIRNFAILGKSLKEPQPHDLLFAIKPNITAEIPVGITTRISSGIHLQLLLLIVLQGCLKDSLHVLHRKPRRNPGGFLPEMYTGISVNSSSREISAVALKTTSRFAIVIPNICGAYF